MFFAKYDVDGDGEFSYEEGQQLVEDLENDMIDQVRNLVQVYPDKMRVPGTGEAQNWESEDKLRCNSSPYQSRGVWNVKYFYIKILFHFISS